MSLVALAVALLVVAVVVVSRPTKPTLTLRDPSTLPHVDRPFPKITSNISLDENGMSALLSKYQQAIDRDRAMAGALSITFATRSPGEQLVAQVAIKSGNLDSAFRWSLQSDPPTVNDVSVPLLLTFSSEPRHEPVAPGGNAADNVIRKQLEHAPVIVRGTQLKTPYWDAFTASGDRSRSGTLAVDVELTESRVYEVCGSIRDFMPKESAGPPCPKVKHVAGDHVILDAYVDFTLDGDDGWKDPLDRHWYGDELREVEVKNSLF